MEEVYILNIREIQEYELMELLGLYTYLGDNQVPDDIENLQSLWKEIINDQKHHIIVCKINDKIVSSCVLIIVPNLTHNQRPYGLIENVVTHVDYRNKGYASEVLAYAKRLAKKENCYKMMLLTGSKKESTMNFYEKSGFNRNDKTAFVMWI